MILPMANGNGGMNLLVIPTSSGPPAPPESYESAFLTGDEIRVEVTFNTSDKNRADALERELLDKMNWKVAPEEAASPPSRTSEMAGTALVVLGGYVVVFIIGFFFAICGELFMDYNSVKPFITWMLHDGAMMGGMALLLFPIVNGIFFEDETKAKQPARPIT